MITTEQIHKKLSAYKVEMGLRLRTDRELNELSLGQLATLTNVSISKLTALENGLYAGPIEPFFKVSLVNELFFQHMNQEAQKLFEHLRTESTLAASLDSLNPFSKK